jgi:hypothetical protein
MGAVTWTTSNPAVATVTQGGVVSAVARGSATITVRSVADPTKFATSTITVIGIISMSLNPGTDSLRVGWNRTFVATVVADPGVPTTVAWSSRDPLVATVNGSGMVTGVSLGSALIDATSTADPAQQVTGQANVMSPCNVPWPHTIGQVFNGTVTASSCNGNLEHIGFSVSGTTSFLASGTAFFSFDHAPLVPPNGYWFTGSIPGGTTNTWPVLAGTGTYSSFVRANPTGGVGPVSISTAPWTLTGFCSFMATTGISSEAISLSSACTGYQPPGTVGTFYSLRAYLMPPLANGETITIMAQAIGFEPRLDLVTGGGALAATASAIAGSSTVTLSHTATAGTAGFFQLRAMAKVALTTGAVRLTITGPAASRHGSRARASAAQRIGSGSIPSVPTPPPTSPP